jgi:hypothetical protein
MKFGNPDFLTEVERATVQMRRTQNSIINPNEAREGIGLEPRTDPGGEEFVELNNKKGSGNNQGSPPEGREDRPDAPSEIDEPTLDDQDPPRGDNHDDEARSFIGELRTWRKFALKRVSKGTELRDFNSEILPDEVRNMIQERITSLETVDEVAELFDSAINLVERDFFGG